MARSFDYYVVRLPITGELLNPIPGPGNTSLPSNSTDSLILPKPTSIEISKSIPALIRDSRNDLAKVTVFVSIRLESTLYSSPGFLDIIKMKKESLVNTVDNKTTILRISNFNDAARLAAFECYSCTLIAKDPNATYGPFGAKHKTTFVVNFDVNRRRIVSKLEEYTFSIGETNVEYVIEKGSVKPKKEKRSAPRITA